MRALAARLCLMLTATSFLTLCAEYTYLFANRQLEAMATADRITGLILALVLLFIILDVWRTQIAHRKMRIL